MTLNRPTKKGEKITLAILAACGLLLLSLAFFTRPGAKGPFNWGFGPQWSCNAQGIEPACLHK